ncbi:MAG: ADP-ribosylglycohydrolase family protein [Verrucomicrobia bacterium]|nr:ADP-ribosylglycohydrolase family protein [Verrucomicrobiota bacterium]
MSQWATLYELLRDEFIQRADEGCRIPLSLRERFARLDSRAEAWNLAALQPIYDALEALEPDAALAAREPNDLEAIRTLRPAGHRDLHWSPSNDEAIDRFHGAWLGRASGCALGKPVEGMGMGWRAGRQCGRADIKRYLQNRGDWPLKDYFSGRDAGDGMKIGCELSQREGIAFMEPDDDIHYALIGVHIVRHAGPGFTWTDVAGAWLSHIPFGSICTAETQAYLNFANRSSRCGPDGTGAKGINLAANPAYTRRHWNPYREWIGAQIRSDGFAWCCAGKPELAAEFAWRDASWTHERNGIYGEMFCAAMQAAAFVENDAAKLVQIGLSEIPAECRLAQAVRNCLQWIAASPDWESCMDKVDAAFPQMSAVHTINNALICVMSLFYGRMDTVLTPAIAVMGALDTDCNGATVGSIVGAAAGKAHFRMDLAGRLNDTVKPNITGYQQTTFREQAGQIHEAWLKTDAYWKQRQSPPHPAAAKA